MNSGSETSRREFLGSLALSAAFATARTVLGDHRVRVAPEPRRRIFAAHEMIGRVTSDSAVVNLVTERAFRGGIAARVRWAQTLEELDTAPRLTLPSVALGPLARLELPLSDLPADRTVFFRVEYQDSVRPGVWQARSEVGRFQTQKPVGRSFSFAVLADGHWGDAQNVGVGDPQRWTGRQCLRQVDADGPFDFLVDLGDSPQPIEIRSAHEALERYLAWRRLMQRLTRQMPTFLALGNHEQEAGFFQRGSGAFPPPEPDNGLSTEQFHQKWATAARLLCIPNPRGDTYAEGGEGAAGYDSRDDWFGEAGPWNDDPPSELQNFYAWSWGDATFIVLDPLRYTHVGRSVFPTLPSDWTLGPTQFAWLEATLAASTARWKFIFCHHLVGGGFIGVNGRRTAQDGSERVYGRGSADEAGRENTEQALIHQLMLQHGAQFFVYGHDHNFCHSTRDGVNYLCCGRPTHLNPWLRRDGMRDSYGDVLIQGADKPWIRALYNVLGYSRFTVSPDNVTLDWIRTGYSFGSRGVPVAQAERDWLEGWVGHAYVVDSPRLVTVDLAPSDVDAVRTADGAQLFGMGVSPLGASFYRQPTPVRPEHFETAEISLRPFPESTAIVDTVPELVSRIVFA